MKIKFTLDDMTDIYNLTSGKEYTVIDTNTFDCENLVTIYNDVNTPIVVALEISNFNCSHLNERANWEVVDK